MVCLMCTLMTSDVTDNKRVIIEFLRCNDDSLNGLNISQVELKLFKMPDYLRLTTSGFKLLSKHFKIYEYKFKDDDKFDSKHLISLVRILSYPYYLTHKRLVIFSEKDAFIINLHGKDLKSWLKNPSDKI